MAIQFKKKPQEAVSDTADSDHAAMVAAGLVPEVKATSKGIVIKKAPQFEVGATIRITNDKFHWIKHYKAGDTGFITKVSVPQTKVNPNVPSAPIFHVLLDHPRVPGQEEVLLAAWEMELLA